MTENSGVHAENYLGGEFRDSKRAERIRSTNPATGELVGTAPLSSLEEVKEAVEIARRSFENSNWSRDPVLRARSLQKLASLLTEHLSEMAELLIIDGGKTQADAEAELRICIDTLEYYGGLARALYGRSVDLSPTSFGILVREPLGVVGIVTPWNWPVLLLVRSLAPALAAGNTVVIKPSSLTPIVNYRLMQLVELTGGFPKGVVNCVTGEGRIAGAELARNEDVDMISFTGETETGKEIMRLASNNVKKVSLELGGKSPNIVFADAPFEKAISAAVKGAFLTSGQVCFSGSRLLLEESIHDKFIRRATEVIHGMKVGYGIHKDVDLGPLISESQLEKVLEYVGEGKRTSNLIMGGERITTGGLAKGFFVQPTVFDDVPQDSRIAQEEIFGPVLSIIPFKEDEEATAIANNTKFGLAAAVWTKDIDRALKMARKIRAGTVWINTYGKNYAAAEFGGFKQSGLGRLRGFEGLHEFTEMKHINIDSS